MKNSTITIDKFYKVFDEYVEEKIYQKEFTFQFYLEQCIKNGKIDDFFQRAGRETPNGWYQISYEARLNWLQDNDTSDIIDAALDGYSGWWEKKKAELVENAWDALFE